MTKWISTAGIEKSESVPPNWTNAGNGKCKTVPQTTTTTNYSDHYISLVSLGYQNGIQNDWNKRDCERRQRVCPSVLSQTTTTICFVLLRDLESKQWKKWDSDWNWNGRRNQSKCFHIIAKILFTPADEKGLF